MTTPASKRERKFTPPAALREFPRPHHGAFLLNRMMIGVAADVKRYVAAVIGLEPIEVDDARELAGTKPMVLAVGWRHFFGDGTERYGADVLEQAARTARPDVLIFVIPDRLIAHRYARERAAFDRVVAAGFAVWVLEIAELRALGIDAAVSTARANIFARDGERGVFLLLAAAGGAEAAR